MANKLSTELQKHFNAFREQKKTASESLAKVRASIRDLRQEAGELAAGPVAREDFLQALYVDIDKRTEEGRQRMQEMVYKHVKNDDASNRGSHVRGFHFQLTHVRDVIGGAASFGPAGFALVCASNPNDFAHDGGFDYVGMCTVFGEQMKEAAARNLAAFDWPYPDATSASVRVARLAEIEEELRPLRAQEAELLAMLEAVGGPDKVPRD